MGIKDKKFTYTVATLFIAALLWYITFIVKPLNFWVSMSISVSSLVFLGVLIKRDLLKLGKVTMRHVVIGIISAAILYFVFYVGNIISGYLFSFKDIQISSIYSNKAEGNLFLIGTLLLFIIGPGEEIYWRGFIQNTFSEKYGENIGYIISALLYGVVHVTTGNFMIILAALVCGLFWGLLYKMEKSLVPVIISHALWDVTIFILFPVM